MSPPATAALSGAHADKLPHRCLIKLKGIYRTLKSAERRAADHLLAAPEEVPGAGIVEFAHRAGCSEATVVRLARKLSYAGFPELKEDFARVGTEVPYRDIRLSDPPGDVVRRVFENSIQALRDTLAALDFDQYRRAVEALLHAERIALFGLGNAAVVAREAYQEFLRIGVPCYTAEDPDLQLIIVSSQLARGDVLIAISYTGESKPMITAARQARARGVKVLAITNFPRSTLARLADLVLVTAVFQEHVNGEIGSKRLAQLCVLESLYVNYLLRKGARVRKNLVASNRALGLNKTHTYVTPAEI
jgi:RpiR family transcriptional regulator, carbohydrate utilization regulator